MISTLRRRSSAVLDEAMDERPCAAVELVLLELRPRVEVRHDPEAGVGGVPEVAGAGARDAVLHDLAVRVVAAVDADAGRVLDDVAADLAHRHPGHGDCAYAGARDAVLGERD